jgi:hypothetical protein
MKLPYNIFILSFKYFNSNSMKRIILIAILLFLTLYQCKMSQDNRIIMTVNGPVPAEKMGK